MADYDPEQTLFAEISVLVEQARATVAAHAHHTATRLYWQIGTMITSRKTYEILNGLALKKETRNTYSADRGSGVCDTRENQNTTRHEAIIMFQKVRAKNGETTATILGTSIWVPVVVAVLTCILGVILSSIQNQIGAFSLISALVLVMIIQYISFSLIANKVAPYSIEQIEILRNEIDRIKDKNSIDFLLDNEELGVFEENFPSPSEIWLISNDLGEDIPGELFFDIVRKNLERKIEYVFFYPKTFEAKARATQLIENHKKTGDVKCIPLSEDFFFLVPRMDFAIYDPHNKLNNRCGYMGLPNPEKSGRYHCFMEPKFIDLLIGKLQTLIQTHSTEERN